MREVALVPNADGMIVLKLYPGDSVSQAREFYADVNADRFLGLERLGWKIRPNLHFAFIQKNMYWPKAQRSLARYLAFWSEKSAMIQKWDREYFAELFDRLKLARQLLDEDVIELHTIFLESGRKSLNLCPGFELLYEWTLSEAVTLDAAGAFAARVRDTLHEAFQAWGQILSEARGES